MERIKLFLFNKKTWVHQLQYIGYSIILVMIVIAIDTKSLPLEFYIPSLMFTSVDLAKTILGALAGALLTITTFTFSTIMTVVTYYAANFTPRAINDFVKLDIVTKILGIFMGGFFYSITALVFMRDSLANEQVIAGTIGVIYVIVALIYFIRFVQQVLHSSRGVNLIDQLQKETRLLIKEEIDNRKNIKTQQFKAQCNEAIEIKATHSGYLSAIHIEDLVTMFKGTKSVLESDCKYGDFLLEGEVIATLYSNEQDVDLKKVANNFAIQEEKIPNEDYYFGLLKILEITLRALSPGTNDPYTAVHCINNLTVIMSDLLKCDGSYYIEGSEEDVQLLMKVKTVEEELYDVYSLIFHYGKNDTLVMQTTMQSLQKLYINAASPHKKTVQQFIDYMYNEVLTDVKLSKDRQRIDKIYSNFQNSCHTPDH